MKKCIILILFILSIYFNFIFMNIECWNFNIYLKSLIQCGALVSILLSAVLVVYSIILFIEKEDK